MSRKMNLTQKGYCGVYLKYVSQPPHQWASGDEFCRLRGWGDSTSPTRYFPAILYDYFIGTNKEKEQTADKAVQEVLGNRVSVFGTPDIILADKDSRVVGSEFSRFRNEQNITCQTVTPWQHQSMGILKGDGCILKILRYRKKVIERIYKVDP